MGILASVSAAPPDFLVENPFCCLVLEGYGTVRSLRSWWGTVRTQTRVLGVLFKGFHVMILQDPKKIPRCYWFIILHNCRMEEDSLLSVVFWDTQWYLSCRQKGSKWALCWINKLAFRQLFLAYLLCVQTHVCSYADIFPISACIYTYVCSGRHVHTLSRPLSGEQFPPFKLLELHCTH